MIRESATRSLLPACLFALVLVTSASSPPVRAASPPPPSVDARAWVLMDHASGRLLGERNGDQRRPPASLTKIMTAYVVFRELAAGRIRLSDQVVISEKAWKRGGSRTFLEVGTRVPLEVLIKGMIVQSGNDASVALAEHVAGSIESFAGLMNQEAGRLGLTNTHFVNPDGLPSPDHYSSARDIAVLTRALIREFPQWYRWYSLREFTYNGIRQSNRNRLLWLDDSVDGVKTGYTAAAGYCLVSSARQGPMRLISVVMGAPSPRARVAASRALLKYGFRFFETRRLYAAGEPVLEVPVWDGASAAVPMGLEEDLLVTVPRDEAERLEARPEVPEHVTAPVAQGQPYGRIVVTSDGETLERRPLIALRTVPRGSLWQRIRGRVMRLFE